MMMFEKKLRKIATLATAAADAFANDPVPKICKKKHIETAISDRTLWDLVNAIAGLSRDIDSNRYPLSLINDMSSCLYNRKNPGTYANIKKSLKAKC